MAEARPQRGARHDEGHEQGDGELHPVGENVVQFDFRYTSELARLYGVKDAAVTPYVSLGQGWQRAGTTRHDIRQSRNTFSMDFDYDTAYSALIGAQINRKE